MSTTKDETWLLRAIEEAVRNKVAQIAAEEIDEAHKRVSGRVKDEIDRIALKAMSHYEAYSDIHGIHIIVKKEI